MRVKTGMLLEEDTDWAPAGWNVLRTYDKGTWRKLVDRLEKHRFGVATDVMAKDCGLYDEIAWSPDVHYIVLSELR